MKTRKSIISLFVALLLSMNLMAQETEKSEAAEKDNRPVRSPFESDLLIDNYTIKQLKSKSLEFVIQHRFGLMNSEEFDLLGIYSPGANIRLGLTYGITDNISVGFGTMKTNKIQDLNWKWSILEQTRSGSIPVSLSYYGNVEYDARKKESFGKEYNTAHRVSYFHELMVARKFSDKLSLQLGVAYSHFNQIDTSVYIDAVHDNVSVHLLGRYKIASSLGVIVAYNQSLTTPEDIKPGLGIGIEIGTSAHAFQVFVNSADAISRQSIQTRNRNDFTNNDFMIGFNITRLWYF